MGVDIENSSLVSEENRLMADVEFDNFLGVLVQRIENTMSATVKISLFFHKIQNIILLGSDKSIWSSVENKIHNG